MDFILSKLLFSNSTPSLPHESSRVVAKGIEYRKPGGGLCRRFYEYRYLYSVSGKCNSHIFIVRQKRKIDRPLDGCIDSSTKNGTIFNRIKHENYNKIQDSNIRHHWLNFIGNRFVLQLFCSLTNDFKTPLIVERFNNF